MVEEEEEKAVVYGPAEPPTPALSPYLIDDLSDIVGSFLRVDFLSSAGPIVRHTTRDRIARDQEQEFALELLVVDEEINNIDEESSVHQWLAANRILLAQMTRHHCNPDLPNGILYIAEDLAGNVPHGPFLESLPWEAWVESSTGAELRALCDFHAKFEFTTADNGVTAMHRVQESVVASLPDVRTFFLLAAKRRLPHNALGDNQAVPSLLRPPFLTVVAGKAPAPMLQFVSPNPLREMEVPLERTLRSDRIWNSVWKPFMASPHRFFAEAVVRASRGQMRPFPMRPPTALEPQIRLHSMDLDTELREVRACTTDEQREAFLRSWAQSMRRMEWMKRHHELLMKGVRKGCPPSIILHTSATCLELTHMGDINRLTECLPWDDIFRDPVYVMRLACTTFTMSDFFGITQQEFKAYLKDVFHTVGRSLPRFLMLIRTGRMPHFAWSRTTEVNYERWRFIEEGRGSVLYCLEQVSDVPVEQLLQSEAAWAAYRHIVMQPEVALKWILAGALAEEEVAPPPPPPPPAPASSSSSSRPRDASSSSSSEGERATKRTRV